MNFKRYVESSDSWVDSHYIMGTDTDTITTLPATLYPNDTSITVGIKGQSSQSGTPSPSNPVDVVGCGDRTGNLLEYYVDAIIGADGAVSASQSYQTYFAQVQGGETYTMGSNIDVYGFFSSKPAIGSVTNDGTRHFYSSTVGGVITIPEGTTWLGCRVRYGENAMLNSDSTALPYEPYGYKIPILIGGNTINKYLGEVQTTRQIKKLVLTGQEPNWNVDSTNLWHLYINDVPATPIEGSPSLYCTHYEGVESKGAYSGLTNGKACIRSSGNYIWIRDSQFANLNEFKNFLQQQYQNGTPVCVWYVLATSQTATVNEPLMKIGTYADSLTTSIPCTAGENTLDVQTTVQPSEVSAGFSGWHNASEIVHRYQYGEWDGSPPPANPWEQFRDLVRSGEAQSLYPIGTKLYENWGDTTSNAWIVVDYPTGEDYLDSDLAQQGYINRVMLMEEKLNYLRQFDAIEAWLYVETAIPAGTYRFTIPNYDTTHGGNKTYIFTSTADVPVGGQLTLTWAYNTNPTKVQGYSSSTSTSALFDVTIAEWDGTTACTDLGTIKLAQNDADSTYGKLNHIHRARYGSNNYYQSGYRQWLNANTSSNWWTPSNIFDRPYDDRNTEGRLNVLNSNMKSVIATPTVNCITNSLFEYPSLDGTTFSLQTAYTVKDKLFPVTHSEINLSSSPNVNSVLDYYVGAQNADRIKYRKDNGNAYYWWLRTPYPTYASYVRHVYTSGALYDNVAFLTYGSAAACIIQ